MPVYQFEAMDPTGQEIRDEIDAANEGEALTTLRQKGYFVTKISVTKISVKKQAASADGKSGMKPDSTPKTLNVSGCIFTIDPQQGDIRQGDTIGFEITVTGGEKRVIADEISISLQECMEGRSGTGRSTSIKHLDYATMSLATNLTLEAGESHSFEFKTRLPDDCRLSDGRVPMRDGWCLYIHVDTAEYRASLRGKGLGIIRAMMNGLANVIGENATGFVLDRDPSKRYFLEVKSK